MAEKPTYGELEQKVKQLEQAQYTHGVLGSRAREDRRLVESIGQVDQAIQSTDAVEGMLDRVVEVVLEIFQCDRAWLFHPCNPDAASFSVTVEGTTADYPGAKALGIEVPMTNDMADYCHRVLVAPGQVIADPLPGEEMANDIAKQFNVRSLLLMALCPKIGEKWMFGLHQCDHCRDWTEEDKRLFRQIGFRITDALSNKLYLEQLKESSEEDVKSKRTILRLHKKKDGTVFPVEITANRSGLDGRQTNISAVRDITGRKQAEEALRENKEKFSKIFHLTPSAIAISDMETGEYIDINDVFCTIFGYKRSEVIGRKSTELGLWHPEARRNVMQRLQHEGHLRNIEVTARAKGGVALQGLFSADYLKTQGKYHLLTTFTDITERKHKEMELERSQNTLLEAEKLAGLGSWEWDIVNDMWYVSQNWQCIHGYHRRSLTTSELLPIAHEEDIPRIETAFAQAVQKGEPYSIEHRIIRQDTGEVRDMQAYGSLKRDASGKAVKMFGTVQDITGRKRAKDEMAKQKNLFETMFNTIPDGVVITNTRREIQLANKGMESTFGYKPEELLGKTTEELYADRGNYLQAGTAVFDKSAKDERDLYVTSYRNKAGHEFSGETFGAKLFDENGRWIGNLGVMRDITERKKLESQIRQTQKMQAIGTLAGGIAHDFNNILTPVIIQTELALMQTDEDGPLRGSLQEVLEAGYRAKNLVKQILTFSRREETERALLVMAPIVKEALKLLRSTLPTTIRIEKQIEEETGNLLADPTQIHQVLMNLCTNAAHAMRETGGVLKVSLSEINVDGDEAREHQSIDPGRYVRLTVADTGHGIDSFLKERIFEPFFTTKDRAEGTGMGLSVVHGIVESYGGSIRVESELEQGTTFTVLLPSTPSKTRSAFTPDEKLPGGSERVLVVDDEPSMVKAVEGMLTQLGYTVVGRTSSIAALEEFRATPEDYDLVITDQTMPNMTGVELSRALLQVRQDLPIILCTGFSDLVDEEKAKKEGIKQYALKPIVLKEMANAVRSALDG